MAGYEHALLPRNHLGSYYHHCDSGQHLTDIHAAPTDFSSREEELGIIWTRLEAIPCSSDHRQSTSLLPAFAVQSNLYLEFRIKEVRRLSSIFTLLSFLLYFRNVFPTKPCEHVFTSRESLELLLFVALKFI